MSMFGTRSTLARGERDAQRFVASTVRQESSTYRFRRGSCGSPHATERSLSQKAGVLSHGGPRS